MLLLIACHYGRVCVLCICVYFLSTVGLQLHDNIVTQILYTYMHLRMIYTGLSNCYVYYFHCLLYAASNFCMRHHCQFFQQQKTLFSCNVHDTTPVCIQAQIFINVNAIAA